MKESRTPMPSQPAPRPDVSVVVLSFVPSLAQQRCLRALAEQTLAASRYEIILVEASASAVKGMPATAIESRQHPAVPQLLRVRARRRKPAVAYNDGWRRARGEIVAFTDDRSVPDRHWLSRGVRALRPDSAAVAGRVVVAETRAPTESDRADLQLRSAEFTSANSFVRRRDLEALAGFDERFGRWRFDTDLLFRLLNRGARVERAPRCIVRRPLYASQWGHSLYQARSILGDVLLYRKHPGLYRSHIMAIRRWDHYVIVLLLIGAVAASSTGHPALALGLLAVWVGLTVLLWVRHLAGTARNASNLAEALLVALAAPVASVFWRIVGYIRFRRVLL